MQRSLIIAAALASIGASAVAQSTITLYGRINTTVERQKDAVTGDNDTAVASNISHIGLRGGEDLGGGLKAGFNLEHELNSNDGTQTATSFWNRASEVNLSSNSFGTVRLGNFISEAYYATADSVSLHNHDAGTSADRLYVNFSRNTSKVAYRTPTIAGATLEAAVSAADGNPNRTYDVAANYDAGSLHAGLGFTKDGGNREVSVSGKYTLMGALTVGGYLQYAKFDPALLVGNRKSARLSAMYAIGNTEVHANFGMAGSYSNVSGTSAKQYTVGVNQNLSKRTKVYAYATKLGGDAGIAYAIAGNGGVERSFAVGVRHSF